MTRELHLRRHAEIEAKLTSLEQELQDWQKLTESETLGFRRHYSQLGALVPTFNGLLEHVKSELAARPIELSVLEKGVEWEKEILAAHSIWEVFRSKFILRQSELFRRYLAACDDLAWACYEPALKRLAPGVKKTPPLVFLSSTWSPFAQTRDANFQNEVRAPSAVLGDEAFQDVLRRLPVPLVGLPWYQVVHVPGAILLAHEVGHVVERDFDLTASLAKAISESGANNVDVWLGWASEMFADVYGCLAMGPAFVGALMDLLATSVSGVQNEQRHGGKYPTRALRVEIALTALAQNGHEAQSKRLRAFWETTFGAPAAAMNDMAADVSKIVAAIGAGPYAGVALTDVISLTEDAANLKLLADSAASNRPGSLAGVSDPRRLFEAAQELHEQPRDRQSSEAFDLLITQVSNKGGKQYRARGMPATTAGAPAAAVDPKVSEEFRASGRELRAFLKQN